MTSHIYDLIIIGSGPAGLLQQLYARACLDTLIIERSTVSGGQILNTYEVDNYPGYPGISSYELGMTAGTCQIIWVRNLKKIQF